MQIPFRRITQTPVKFDITENGIGFTGELESYKRDFVTCNALIHGKISLICDKCGVDFDTNLHEEIKILLHNGIFHGNDTNYDIIEVLNEVIDMDEILLSEVESFKSGYH